MNKTLCLVTITHLQEQIALLKTSLENMTDAELLNFREMLLNTINDFSNTIYNEDKTFIYEHYMAGYKDGHSIGFREGQCSLMDSLYTYLQANREIDLNYYKKWVKHHLNIDL